MKERFGALAERFADEIAVKRLNFRVVAARSERDLGVAVEKTVGAFLPPSVVRAPHSADLRLSAPSDATARAGHYFDEIKVDFAGCFQRFQERTNRRQAARDRDAHRFAADLDRRRLQRFHSPKRFKFQQLSRRIGSLDDLPKVAQRRFRDAAGRAENFSGAAPVPERRVERLVVERRRVDLRLEKPRGEFAGRQREVEVANFLVFPIPPRR